MRTEGAEPILPARNVNEAREFYQMLGFRAWQHGTDYDIVSRGPIVVHLQAHPDLKPDASETSCYWRVEDADQLYRELAGVKLPTAGIPRLTEPRDEPWGMREFTLVDPSGNLIRIGHELGTD